MTEMLQCTPILFRPTDALDSASRLLAVLGVSNDFRLSYLPLSYSKHIIPFHVFGFLGFLPSGMGVSAPHNTCSHHRSCKPVCNLQTSKTAASVCPATPHRIRLQAFRLR